ncbi:hypothetical protein C0J52_07839 [Blattella germanica]|nr:hypothetical protein C0J52_07839 [Blattella germanica]
MYLCSRGTHFATTLFILKSSVKLTELNTNLQQLHQSLFSGLLLIYMDYFVHFAKEGQPEFL